LSSDPDYCHYKHQPDTIAAILGIQDHQAPSSVCDDKGCDCQYQDGRHVPILKNEVYKVITALEDASLLPGHGFSIFTVLYSCQPSHTAIEKVQQNIQELQMMVKQLGKLFKAINKSNRDQETMEAYEHIYTSVSEKYFNHLQRIRRLNTTKR
jgi:hypothetical protein